MDEYLNKLIADNTLWNIPAKDLDIVHDDHQLDFGSCAMTQETVCLDKRIEADIASGVYDHNPQALIDHCKGQYRQQVLADAASEKIKTMNFCDEIEVRLGLIVAFNSEFKLPAQMNTMLYPRCSGIKAMDLLNVRKKLTNQELASQKLTGDEQTVLALAERIGLTGVEQTTLTDEEKKALTGFGQPKLSVEEEALKQEVSVAAQGGNLTDAGRAENNRLGLIERVIGSGNINASLD